MSIKGRKRQKYSPELNAKLENWNLRLNEKLEAVKVAEEGVREEQAARAAEDCFVSYIFLVRDFILTDGIGRVSEGNSQVRHRREVNSREGFVFRCVAHPRCPCA